MPRCLVLQMFVQFSDRSLANLLLSKHWLCGMGLLLIGASSLYGQDSWQGSSGSWFTGSAWSLGMPPNFDLDAVIDNGATVQIGPGPDGQEAAANSLTIGGGSTVALLSGGTLNLNNPLLINSSGTLLLNGGTLGGAGTIQDNGIVEFLGSFVYTESVDAHIVGTGSLVLNLTGGALLVDSTGNTYSGQTQILNGSLVAEPTNAFSQNSAFTVKSQFTL